jgi:glutamate carboxypeptidase
MGAVQEYRQVFDWIDAQTARMRSLVSQWASINSFSYNTAGLQQIAEALKKEWRALGDLEELSLPAAESIDSDGEIVHAPLGRALRIRKRPDASRQSFLCIHMDTVYPPEGSFREVTLIDRNRRWRCERGAGGDVDRSRGARKKSVGRQRRLGSADQPG